MKLQHLFEAAKKSTANLPTERVIELIQRRLRHLERVPHHGNNDIHTKMGRRIRTSAHNRYNRLKIRDLTLVKDPQVLSDYLTDKQFQYAERFVNTCVDYVGSPGKFEVIPTPLGASDTLNYAYATVDKAHHLDHLPLVYIFNKAVLHDAGFDRDDAEEFVDEDERLSNRNERIKKLEGQLTRLQKKYNEEQTTNLRTTQPSSAAPTKQRVYTSYAETGAPPKAVLFGGSNLNNPYWTGSQFRYFGDPLNAPYQTSRMKALMNVMILACKKVGHPLTHMYYSCRTTSHYQRVDRK